MDALVASINKLTKGLVVKKPKKKKRVYMDMDSEPELALQTGNSEEHGCSLSAQLNSPEIKEEEPQQLPPVFPSVAMLRPEETASDFVSKKMLFQDLPFLTYFEQSKMFPLQVSQSTLDCAQSYVYAPRFAGCSFMPGGSSAFLSSASSLPQPPELPKERLSFQPYIHQSQLIRPTVVTMALASPLQYSQPLPKPTSEH